MNPSSVSKYIYTEVTRYTNLNCFYDENRSWPPTKIIERVFSLTFKDNLHLSKECLHLNCSPELSLAKL